MAIVSNVLRSTASTPININEFFRAFATIWSPAARSRCFESLINVGLAISGGVDSMALAALCSKLNNVDLKEFIESEHDGFERHQRLSFKAFIVDHGARVGSQEEAFLVSKNLDKIGIPAQILRLQWPSGCKPSELSNFESVARTLRYQALGKACYNHKIEPLLTAHHEDDQVETVIMRLLRGERGMNLKGIRSVSHIPECHGIYGVNRSGGLFYQSQHDGYEERSTQEIRIMQPISMLMETGGIQLYRPLLNFSKSRLIATSIHLNTPWFEDRTNKDPTLTQRNTIRHFYQNHLMPKALSKLAILQLAQKMLIKDLREKAKTESFLSKTCVIENINWNAGSLEVRLPKISGNELNNEEARNLEKKRKADLLRRLIYFVTPNENVLLSSLETACKSVFPELFLECTAERQPISERNHVEAFTVAGVHFTKIAVALLPSDKIPRDSRQDCQLDEEFIWVLSRQAYKRSEEPPCITFSPASTTPCEQFDSSLSAKSWSPWHLYDGRFWVRVSNNTAFPIIIRPFNKYDMSRFDTWPKHLYSGKETEKLLSLDMDEISKGEFARLLKMHFPGNIRYTLPAIVTLYEGRETVLALPTIGVVSKGVREICLDWDFRYKCVDEMYHLPRRHGARLPQTATSTKTP